MQIPESLPMRSKSKHFVEEEKISDSSPFPVRKDEDTGMRKVESAF